MKQLQDFTDKELYAECKKWGAVALEARRKFAGLLPEVNRREVRERVHGKSWLRRKGYSGIFEFAARLAGMSRDQVNRVFCVNERLSGVPALRKLLVSGEVSVNKLARIVSIATVDNQEDLAEKVKILSQRAVETYVRDLKSVKLVAVSKNELGKQSGLFEPHTDVHVHEIETGPSSTVNVNQGLKLMQTLSEEVKAKLVQLSDQGHDINEILMKLLDKREDEIEKNMQEVSEQVRVEQAAKELISFPTNRYVPAKVRKVVVSKYGGGCSEKGCNNDAEHLHHEKVFAKEGGHDPRLLRPLCWGHHELRHVKDAKVQKFKSMGS